MEQAILNAEQVTPDWLTEVLRAHGILSRGAVTGVIRGEVKPAFASSVCRLEVTYSQDAPPDVPAKLFLKIANEPPVSGGLDPQEINKETTFYAEHAPAMGAAYTIPCYQAVYEPETGRSHILLKDVSDTHVSSLSPADVRNCERAVETLASLHAFWWDHPRLGKEVGRYPTQEQRQQEWIEAEKHTTAFMAALGDQLLEPWADAYKQVLPALPDLFKRHATGRHMTLAHGDAHLGNFLFPRDGQGETTYLLDWQFWHPTIGGTDLAFMIATEWEPETRRGLEEGLLQRYYRGLTAHGVQDYSWEDCWNDYRLSVILESIFIPVWRWALFKWAPDLPALHSSMTAFEDLKCAELI